MQQLIGLDASFLYAETDALKVHYSVLTIYDQSDLEEPLSFRKILAYFDERTRGIPLFRRKLYFVPMELDSPYFADDPGFNIETHVRHIALPKPGDWRKFCILAAQIQSLPMDLNKPLWDMHVIEGLDNVEGLPAGSFAILTRLHHAIADGTTARGILMALHHPKDNLPEPLPAADQQEPPSLIQMAVRGTLNNIRNFSEISTQLSKAVPSALGTLTRSTTDNWLGKDDKPGNSHVPKTIFNGDMEYRRVFQLRRYPLEELKRMRALVPDSTLNDVLLTLIGGGMKRYLATQGKSHDVNLVALCPINLRSNKLTNDCLEGNSISVMTINLHTRLANPAQRLKKIVAMTTDAKLPQKAEEAKKMVKLAESAPNLMLAMGARFATRAALAGDAVIANCMITNVPGPQVPLYFMGARLELITGLMPITSGTGISIPVSSYCDQVCVSVTGCRSWIEHPQAFATCLDESYEEMRKAAAKLVAKAAAKPVVKVASHSAAKPASKPKAKTAAKPVIKVVAARKTRAAARPVVKVATKPVAKTATKRKTATGSKQAGKAMLKSVAKAPTKPTVKTASRAVPKPAPSPKAKPVVRAATKPVRKVMQKSSVAPRPPLTKLSLVTATNDGRERKHIAH